MAIFNEDLSGLTYQDLVNYKNNLKNSLPNVNMTQNAQSKIGNQARQDLVNFSNDVGGQVQNKFVSGLGYVADKGLAAGENLFNTLDKVGGFVGLGSTGQAEKYAQARQDVKNTLPYYMDQMSLAKQQNVPSVSQSVSSNLTQNKGNQYTNQTGALTNARNQIQANNDVVNNLVAPKQMSNEAYQNMLSNFTIDNRQPQVNIQQQSQPNAFDLYKQNLTMLNNQRQTQQAPSFSQTQQDLMMYDAKDKQDLAKRQQDWADFMMSRSAKAKTKSGAANYANLAGIGLNQAQRTQAGADAVNQLRNQFNQQVGMAGLNQNFNQQNQAYNSMSDLEKLRLQNTLGNENAMRDFNNQLTMLNTKYGLEKNNPEQKIKELQLKAYQEDPTLMFPKSNQPIDYTKRFVTIKNQDGSERIVDLANPQATQNSDALLLEKFTNLTKK